MLFASLITAIRTGNQALDLRQKNHEIKQELDRTFHVTRRFADFQVRSSFWQVYLTRFILSVQNGQPLDKFLESAILVNERLIRDHYSQPESQEAHILSQAADLYRFQIEKETKIYHGASFLQA